MVWIKRYNPTINWWTGTVTIDNKTIAKQQKIQRHQDTHTPPLGTIWGIPALDTLKHLVLLYIERVLDILEDESLTHNPIKIIDQLLETTVHAHKTTTLTKIAIEAQKDKMGKTLEEVLLPYALELQRVFEKKAAECFPASTPWDHAIELKRKFNIHKWQTWHKIYLLTVAEQQELCKSIDKNEVKGFIQKLTSPLTSPFFFISKDRLLRLVQDYKTLNEATVKNVYLLPLINELVNRVQDAQIFTKLDI